MNKKLEALLKTLGIEESPTETISVIHAAFDEKPHVVAMMAVDKALPVSEKLEKAFMLTNSIEDAWWNNKEITKMFDGRSCRSTSVGDMVLIGTEKFKCEAAGWSEV